MMGKASSIVNKTQRVAEITYNVFRLFGLLLNFAPGKTNALIRFAGAGSYEARRRLTFHMGNVIECWGADGRMFKLIV
eukprot:3684747-Karenia_brevis.AAC.1